MFYVMRFAKLHSLNLPSFNSSKIIHRSQRVVSFLAASMSDVMTGDMILSGDKVFFFVPNGIMETTV